MSRRRRRAMSLVEVIVVGSMLLSMLVAIGTFMTISTGYAHQTEAYAYAQREATQIIRSLTRDLNNSVGQWVVPANAPVGYIIFLSPVPANDGGPVQFDPITGTLIWQKWVCYYHDPTNQQLIRCEIPLTPPTSSTAAQPAPISLLPDFQTAAPSQKRTVGHQVARFVVGTTSPNTFDFSVTTTYTAAVATAGDQAKIANVTLASRVNVLN